MDLMNNTMNYDKNTKFMLTILPVIFTIALLLIMTPISADAVTAKGSPGQVAIKSYGSATKSVVCGDQLCSVVLKNIMDEDDLRLIAEEKVKDATYKAMEISEIMERTKAKMMTLGDEYTLEMLDLLAEIEKEGKVMIHDEIKEGTKIRPLQQMKLGVSPENVDCKKGFELMLRPGGSSACIKPTSVPILIELGWTTTK